MTPSITDISDFEYRWNDDYFSFTNPSWELEIKFKNDWLEILGYGIMQPQILKNASKNNHIAWAFGIGIERIVMLLFQIPDIRLFWTEDQRFNKQFDNIDINSKDTIIFKPYSNYPICYKDLSFWINDSNFGDNDFYDIVRNHGESIIERVKLIDEFIHPKNK